MGTAPGRARRDGRGHQYRPILQPYDLSGSSGTDNRGPVDGTRLQLHHGTGLVYQHHPPTAIPTALLLIFQILDISSTDWPVDFGLAAATFSPMKLTAFDGELVLDDSRHAAVP